MTVLFAVFFLLTGFYWLKYRSIARNKEQIISDRQTLDSLSKVEKKIDHSYDSIMRIYYWKLKDLTKNDEYFLVKRLSPIIIKSRLNPSITKILFVASLDKNYEIYLDLGTKVDTSTCKLSGCYKTIFASNSKSLFHSFEINNSEIKPPVTGLIRMFTGTHYIYYPINDDINNYLINNE